MVSSEKGSLLILDLDETLVSAWYKRDCDSSRSWDHEGSFFYLKKRPGLNLFLKDVRASFDAVAVWSSADLSYVKEVLEAVLPKDYPLAFVWGRERCTRRHDPEWRYGKDEFYVKKLAKAARMGWSLSRTVMVDDSKEKLTDNYGNLVLVKPFSGDEEDSELALLAGYLRELSLAKNILSIDKRGWRGDT